MKAFDYIEVGDLEDIPEDLPVDEWLGRSFEWLTPNGSLQGVVAKDKTHLIEPTFQRYGIKLADGPEGYNRFSVGRSGAS